MGKVELFAAFDGVVDFSESFGYAFGSIGSAFNQGAAEFKSNFLILVAAAAAVTFISASAGLAFLTSASAGFVAMALFAFIFTAAAASSVF